MVRPILFLFDPEKAHNLIAFGLKILPYIPALPWLIRRSYGNSPLKVKKTVFGLTFKNPIGLAAGFDKNANLFNELSQFGFGFVEIGTVTPLPQKGNAKPRIFRLVNDKAIINRMGFNNVGLEKVIVNLKNRRSNIILGGNIGKNTLTDNCDCLEDYCKGFNSLYQYVDYLVINISCPNIDNLSELQNKDSLRPIIENLVELRKQKEVYKPVLIKISPDLTISQIDDIIDIILQFSLDGIIATNTTTKRINLTTDPEKISKIGNGGLSGKPLKDTSTAIIKHIHQKTNGEIPIIASGGIMSVEDALEKLAGGASLIQLYTGFIYQGPRLIKKIINALER